MNVKIIYTEDSPYYKNGTKEELFDKVTEVHYNYSSSLEPSTAIESDILGTGCTRLNRHIKEFEVFYK